MPRISSDKPAKKGQLISMRPYFVNKKWLGEDDSELQGVLWEHLRRQNVEKMLTIVNRKEKK